MGNILDKKETESQWDALIEYYVNALDDEEHAIVEHFINSHPRENIFEEMTSVLSKVMIEKVSEYLRPALKDFYKTKSKSKNNSFSYVIMRSDLSSVLSNEDGWIVYSSFEIAVKTAQNFCGVATPFEKARGIISGLAPMEEAQPIVDAFISFPQTNIANLEISRRSYNALRSAGLTDLKDIAKKTQKELLKIKHFGRRSCNEIKETLHDFGLSLK